MKKVIKFLILISIFIVLILPVVSFAQRLPFDQNQGVPFVNNQSSNQGSSGVLCSLKANPKLGDLLNYITCLISRSVIPLIFALATASFIWGVVQYVINTDDEAKKAKGKQFMLWGIIALTVMFTVWGLVGILGKTFGIQNVIPQLNTQKP